MNLQSLKELGLNKYESAAYLALVRTGICTAHVLAKESGVPHGKIYPVLSDLERKGFVKLFESKPKRFIAVEPKIIISNIIGKKKKEFEGFKKTSEKLIQTMGELSEKKPKESFETVRIIEGYDNYLNLSIALHKQAKQEWLSITRLEIYKEHYDVTRDCAKRGVKVKLLSFKDEEKMKRSQLWKKIGCEVRMTDYVPTHFSIIDGKEVTIRITGEERYLALWIRNKSLAQHMRTSFNLLWKKATAL